MRRMVLAIMIGLAAPAAGASELTDAIVPTDPRDRLETGEGAALGSIYSPKTEPAEPSGRRPSAPEDEPSLSGYGSAYDDLRSSLYTSPLEDEAAGDEEEEDDEGYRVEQPYESYGTTAE